jgi:hypothetical protein
MGQDVKTRSWLVAAIVTIVVFIALSALALPRLETSLTFIPLLGLSVLSDVLSGFLTRFRARRTDQRERSGKPL